MPELKKDATDRNRTSPFAFTGKASLSSAWWAPQTSLAAASTVLNTIVAEAFSEAADILEQAEDFEPAVKSVIADLMTKRAHYL